jgi:hypothetical protein
MSQPMPGCEQFAERLAALAVDGDEEFERHAAACDACRRERDRFRGVAELLARGDCAEPPAGLHDRIVRALDDRKGGAGARRRGFWTAGRAASLTVGLAAAAALAWIAWPRRVPHVAERPPSLSGAPKPGDVDDDPFELIGELNTDELARVNDYFKKGA